MRCLSSNFDSFFIRPRAEQRGPCPGRAEEPPGSGNPADRQTEETPARRAIVITGSRIAAPGLCLHQSRCDARPDESLQEHAGDQRRSGRSISCRSSCRARTRARSAPSPAADGPPQPARTRRDPQPRPARTAGGFRLSNAFGVVDVNIIPPNIIENVETITGGASAVYGSDAISGVVNFRTRRSLRRDRSSTRGSAPSFQGDAGTTERRLSRRSRRPTIAPAPGSFRSATSNRDVLWGGDRPEFFSLGVLSSFIGQGTFVPSATNLPTQAAVNAVFAAVWRRARGRAQIRAASGSTTTAPCSRQIGAINYRGPTDRLFSHVRQHRAPAGDDAGIYRPADATRLNRVRNRPNMTSTRQHHRLCAGAPHRLSGDRPGRLVADAVRRAAHRPGDQSVHPGRPADDPGVAAQPDRAVHAQPAVHGLRGPQVHLRRERRPAISSACAASSASRTGPWDIYGLHDEMDMVETQDAALLLSRLQPLLNAADGGASICARRLQSVRPCQRDSACRRLAAIMSKPRRTTSPRPTRTSSRRNLTGSLFALAGRRCPLLADRRPIARTATNMIPIHARENGDLIGTLASVPTEGDINVKELGLRAAAADPARCWPSPKRLEFNLGYRISDYNITGTVSTYRAEGLWRPIPDALLIRGGYERATRAPNIGELFSAAPDRPGPVRHRRRAAAIRATSARPRAPAPTPRRSAPSAWPPACRRRSSTCSSIPRSRSPRRPAAAPRSSPNGRHIHRRRRVLSAPSEARGCPAFRCRSISTTSASTTSSRRSRGPTTLNKCYNLDGSNPDYEAGQPLLPAHQPRFATGGISIVSTPYLNLGGLRTRGFDVQADWRLDLDEVGHPRSAASQRRRQLPRRLWVQILPDSPCVEYRRHDRRHPGGDHAAGRPAAAGLQDLREPDLHASAAASRRLRWRHLPSMRRRDLGHPPGEPGAGRARPTTSSMPTSRSGSTKTSSCWRGITNLFDQDPRAISRHARPDPARDL